MTPPKMPVHIGDYKRDTGHLRAAEHGAYLLLLFHHWSTGSLPDDDRQLSAIACMSSAEWKRARPMLVKFFKPGWVHSRVLVDLQDANETYLKLASAGSKGGKARAEGKRRLSEATSEASSDAQASFKQPITDNQIDRIVDAGASRFTEGSKVLADAFLHALGFLTPLSIPIEFAGISWRAVTWETAGWTADLVAADAKRIGPDKPLTYYEKVFATSFAKRQAPLPVVEVKDAEQLTVTRHGTKTTESLSHVARRHAADGITFGERPPAPGLRVITSGPDVRLLPQGGSERPGDLRSGDGGSVERIPTGGG